LNPGPRDYESPALTAELQARWRTIEAHTARSASGNVSNPVPVFQATAAVTTGSGPLRARWPIRNAVHSLTDGGQGQRFPLAQAHPAPSTSTHRRTRQPKPIITTTRPLSSSKTMSFPPEYRTNWWRRIPTLTGYLSPSIRTVRFYPAKGRLHHYTVRQTAIMDNVFKNPVPWSELAVGSWLRLSSVLIIQIGGFLLLCRWTDWKLWGWMAFFIVLIPTYYLMALRGVHRELHRKTSRPEDCPRAEQGGAQSPLTRRESHPS
jgi:hypothetical protein